ncbi:MAG: HD-GYP domain-containing protein, partial [Chloroflexota bacterium]
LSVAAGGAVLEAINGPARGHPTPGHLPGFAAYALVNTVVNQVLVCTVIGLATRARPWEVAAANFRGVLLPIVALFPLGVLMAVIYVYFGHSLGLLLLAVPTVAVYDALNKAQQLRDHTRATLEVLADAVDRRDRYTAEHSQRVADYAGRIATVLGLSLDQRETIVSAAHVHDLGKVSIPDEVLRKPGNLNDEEWQLMRQHPVAGAEILAQLPMYREGAQLVGAHHERLDGRGYPLGLSGDDLPLGARVIAVADAYDAMTSDRPYRAALPVSVALARLREGAGTQFCPLVVDALAQALGEAQTLGERLAPVEPVASHASHVEPVSLGTAAMSRVSA